MQYNNSLTATVYIVHDNKVLLHMHKKYQTWFPVGGHLHKNELPHEAALREVKEETGLDVSLINTESVMDFDIGLVDRLLNPFLLYHEGGKEDKEEFLDFIYIAKPNDNCILRPQENESLVFKWFGMKDLKDNHTIKIHVRNTAIAVLSFCLTKNI